jgi:GxxExxY protein
VGFEFTAEAQRRRVENKITEAVIGGAIDVHRELGPGLLESAYAECLCYEFSQRGLSFKRQVSLPVSYKGVKLDCGYRIDLLVEDAVIVEIKSVDALIPVHTAQLLTYLKLLDKAVGLLINFNVPVFRRGLKRVVNNFTVQPQRLSASAVESKLPCSNVS